ncbi:hypothetical protein GEMRC1_007588 [Eukaryota sp. GEM-RC1]
MLAEIGSASRITNVAFVGECLVCISETEVFCVNIHSLSRTTIELKPGGPILACSSSLASSVFAFPCAAHGSVSSSSSNKGVVAIANMNSTANPICSVVSAHKTPLTAIAMSVDGSLVATTSQEGTLIRIWNTSGSLISELRRGTRKATVTGLAFGGNSLVALASKKETIHIFNLVNNNHITFDTKNKQPKYVMFDISGELLFVVSLDKTFRILQMKGSGVEQLDRRNF